MSSSRAQVRAQHCTNQSCDLVLCTYRRNGMRLSWRSTGSKRMLPLPKIRTPPCTQKSPRFRIEIQSSNQQSNMSLKDLVIAARSPPLLRSVTDCHLLVTGADVVSRCMFFFHKCRYIPCSASATHCVITSSKLLSVLQVLYYSPVNPSAEHGRSSNSPRLRRSEL